MSDFDKLVFTIMKEAEADGEPVSKEEAEEMASMEMKAKGINKNASAENKPKRKNAHKPDEDKRFLINIIRNTLDYEVFGEIETKNAERELVFVYNGENYSITLTKHRKSK